MDMDITRTGSSTRIVNEKYRFVKQEVQQPVEQIIIHMKKEFVAEFLEADHEVCPVLSCPILSYPVLIPSCPCTQVWTLGECEAFAALGEEAIPIISKDVFVDEGEGEEESIAKIYITIVWESMEKWRRMNEEDIQRKLLARWAERFPHPHTMVRLDEPETTTVKRVSRFERLDR
jgi:hypothetical protein